MMSAGVLLFYSLYVGGLNTGGGPGVDAVTETRFWGADRYWNLAVTDMAE